MRGVMCLGGNDYEFEGWTFEVHRYFGPWPTKKNGDPREFAGRKFWKMWNRFHALTPEQQKQHIVRKGGGCVAFDTGDAK